MADDSNLWSPSVHQQQSYKVWKKDKHATKAECPAIRCTNTHDGTDQETNEKAVPQPGFDTCEVVADPISFIHVHFFKQLLNVDLRDLE